ncbi:hypothetical protein PS914_05606 [Pseudomonas fluorescens]|uniref:Uncharacterized protein n=1 Tax=Pseudomonas fluorescens TaxID=294 RepID=A0A5E7USG0_PSEFL|nr:hypothetical protein PS833_01959 [Pseudomonas fluorescens]VVQ14467.1 hypothetical protein PS914_05606 [Pseudomonas fluorescens]
MSKTGDGFIETVNAVRPLSGGRHDLMELLQRSGRQSRERSPSACRGQTEAWRAVILRVICRRVCS